MKTNKQNKRAKQSTINAHPSTNSGLPIRSEQSGTETTPATATAQTASPETHNSQLTTQNSPSGVKPYVNFAERDFNRSLSVEKVLEKLKRWMPAIYPLAEVVGRRPDSGWVWIAFPEIPAERVRAELSQLGFHWNNTRKCWQHPCGETLPRGTQEPREKYSTWFPATTKPLRRKQAQAQKSEVYFDPAQQAAAAVAAA